MSDEDILREFVMNVTMGENCDPELRVLCKRMDSVENLNSNPGEVRSSGYKAMRRAFLLGARFGERFGAADAVHAGPSK